MANRLLDYKFVDQKGQILDSPQRIGDFLAQWGGDYAEEFPGKNPFDYGYGPAKTQSVTVPFGGSTQKSVDDPRWGSASNLLAMNFFSDPTAAQYMNNPEAIREVLKDPAVYNALQSNINSQAADMRARDSGNIFGKAFKTLSTFASLATGMSGLVSGLAALSSGAGLAGAAKAGISAATSLPKQLGATFFPAGSIGSNPLLGNAVPGIRTGVTTPAGGAAIVGAGKAAPLTGIMGGAPLGASPLAVTGGAAASSLFPRFPELGKVQPLPSGVIPGTNQRIGEAPGKPGVSLSDIKDITESLAKLMGGSRMPQGQSGQPGRSNPLAAEVERNQANPLRASRNLGLGLNYGEEGVNLFTDMIRGARGDAFSSTDPREYYLLNRQLRQA